MWGVGVAQGTGLFDGLDVELLVEIGFLQTSKGVFDESSAAGGQPTCDSFQATAMTRGCPHPPCFHTVQQRWFEQSSFSVVLPGLGKKCPP